MPIYEFDNFRSRFRIYDDSCPLVVLEAGPKLSKYGHYLKYFQSFFPRETEFIVMKRRISKLSTKITFPQRKWRDEKGLIV